MDSEYQRQFNNIIDNWNDFYIDIVIEQQPLFSHIAENIYKVINKLYEKNHFIIDYELLKLTKPFNDAVYAKYGLDFLLEGLRNITGIDRSDNDEAYKQLIVFKIKEQGVIKKGSMKEKNRLKIMNEIKHSKSTKVLS